MNRPLQSIPDLAEQLMREFEALVPMSAITRTVMDLSRDGTATLDVVAELARHELARIAAGVETPNLADAAAVD